MGIASFEKGAVILIKECSHVLKRIFDDSWQVEEEKTGRIKEFKLNQLHRLYQKGELIFANDMKFDPLSADHQKDMKRASAISLITSKDEWDEAKVKRQYILAIMDFPATQKAIEPEIHKVWAQLGANGRAPHWGTVLRWKKRYIHAGKDIYGVVKRIRDRGNRKRRYPREVLAIIEEAVDKVYMTRERKTYEDTLNNAIVRIERENKLRPEEMQLPLPTLRLIKSAVSSISAFDRHAARYGRMAATKMFRAVLKQLVSKSVLERAEIDHTKLDLFVVDDITGMPLGRPWVTICIDSFSRCILGIYIGFEPPSYLTVARCLKHAFMPKVDLQEIYPEIEHAWDAYGVMQILVVDNGLEFHSHALETACFTLGIDLQFTPRKTPWWKGVVERFIGTMNRGIAHGNPGTTFANIFEKDDYDPAKHAVITFSTLKLALHKWGADVYHQRPHRSLDNVSPAVMWESSIRPEEINLPEDPARMDAILGRCHKRILTHKGIEFEGLRYNSPELVALRRRLGDKLEIELRVDEGDLGYIYALSPDHAEHFKVPCLNQEYASGMSLWQHNVCKRYAATHLKISANSNSWRHAKEDIAEIFQREVLNNRLRKSKTASRAVRFKLAGLSENTQVETNANPEVSAAISTPASRPVQHFTVVSPSSSRIIRPKFDVLIENRTASDLC